MLQYFFKKRHSGNTLSAIQGGFPAKLGSDVLDVMTKIIPARIEPHMDPANSFRTVEGSMMIPSRVYFPEISVSEIQKFTQSQIPIFAAIMTRHHSGHQREAGVRRLMSYPSTWTTPFVAILLGDYVREILSAIDDGLTPEWQPFFQDFSQRNPKWMSPLSHRILTYWSIYYRHSFPRFTDYPGYIVAQKIGLWDRKAAPKLMRRLANPIKPSC